MSLGLGYAAESRCGKRHNLCHGMALELAERFKPSGLMSVRSKSSRVKQANTKSESDCAEAAGRLSLGPSRGVEGE